MDIHKLKRRDYILVIGFKEFECTEGAPCTTQSSTCARACEIKVWAKGELL